MKRPLLQLIDQRFPEFEQKELYARIMCGEVAVAGEVVRDPKRPVPTDAEITLERTGYVSRGGLKLERGLDRFKFDPSGLVAVDAGASTGGFTDCLLSHGARHVHSVDVGTNQLAWSLRRRSDVTVHERTNLFDLTSLDPAVDFATADLSFRSLRGAARHLLGLTRLGRLIALVKPQFEWIDPPESFDGVVREAEVRESILYRLVGDLAQEGVALLAGTESPIQGRRGNREFLMMFGSTKDLETVPVVETVRRIVYSAKDALDSGSPT